MSCYNGNGSLVFCLIILYLKKFDSNCTASFINEKLEYDLINDDPEITYNHPSAVLNEIFQLIDREYRKKTKK